MQKKEERSSGGSTELEKRQHALKMKKKKQKKKAQRTNMRRRGGRRKRLRRPLALVELVAEDLVEAGKTHGRADYYRKVFRRYLSLLEYRTPRRLRSTRYGELVQLVVNEKASQGRKSPSETAKQRAQRIWRQNVLRWAHAYSNADDSVPFVVEALRGLRQTVTGELRRIAEGAKLRTQYGDDDQEEASAAAEHRHEEAARRDRIFTVASCNVGLMGVKSNSLRPDDPTALIGRTDKWNEIKEQATLMETDLLALQETGITNNLRLPSFGGLNQQEVLERPLRAASGVQWGGVVTMARHRTRRLPSAVRGCAELLWTETTIPTDRDLSLIHI